MVGSTRTMWSIVAIVCCLVASFRLVAVDARKTTLVFDGAEHSWVYLDKFAFESTSHPPAEITESNTGFLSWDVTGSTANIFLNMYDDQDSSFPSFYPDHQSISCYAKQNMPPARVIIDLSVQPSGSIPLNHPSQRARFWYFALSNCVDNGFPQKTTVELHATNPGDLPTHEFSFDEYGIYGFSIFLFIASMLFGFVAMRNVWDVRSKAAGGVWSLHPTMKGYLACLLLWIAGAFFALIHWMLYAQNGKGVPGLRGFALVTDTAAHVVFIGLLYLFAHGYAITFPHLRNRKLLGMLFTVLVLVHIVLFVYMEVGQDPASTLYGYETPPGIILCCLRLPMLIFFVWALRQTYMAEADDDKRRFYKVFGTVGALWFLVLPITVIIAALTSPWTRAAVVYICSEVFFMMALAVITVTLWPTRLVSRLFKLTPVVNVPAMLSDQPYDEL